MLKVKFRTSHVLYCLNKKTYHSWITLKGPAIFHTNEISGSSNAMIFLSIEGVSMRPSLLKTLVLVLLCK